MNSIQVEIETAHLLAALAAETVGEPIATTSVLRAAMDTPQKLAWRFLQGQFRQPTTMKPSEPDWHDGRWRRLDESARALPFTPTQEPQ